MNHFLKIIAMGSILLTLTACSRGELEITEAFTIMDSHINSASVALDRVRDEKSAHQASKEIFTIHEEFEETVLRIKPFERVSKKEASEIMDGFMRGRAAQDRFRMAVKRIQRHSDAWLILESSTIKLLGSIRKGAVVMRSYIEAAPTSD